MNIRNGLRRGSGSLPRVGLLLLGLVFMCDGNLAAAEPTPQQLLLRVPILSFDNPDIRSFEFTYEAPDLLDKIVVQVAWTNDQGLRLLAVAGKTPVPLLYCTERTSLTFDLTLNQILILPKSSPSFTLLPITDEPGRTEKLNIGVLSGNSKIELDLRGFLNEATEQGTVTAGPENTWQLSTPLKSGEAFALAQFGQAPDYSLQRFEIRSKDGAQEKTKTIVRDIFVNQPPTSRWTPIPSDKQFPAGLEVVHLTPTQEEANITASLMPMMTAIFSHFALAEPKMRKHEAFRNANWSEATQTAKDYGPRMLDLLKPVALAP